MKVSKETIRAHTLSSPPSPTQEHDRACMVVLCVSSRADWSGWLADEPIFWTAQFYGDGGRSALAPSFNFRVQRRAARDTAEGGLPCFPTSSSNSPALAYGLALNVSPRATEMVPLDTLSSLAIG